MTVKLQRLADQLCTVLAERIAPPVLQLNELTVQCKAADYLAVAYVLRDHETLCFQQLIDLSGIDYAHFAGWQDQRFAVVSQLLSLRHNWRLRLRVCAEDDAMPMVDSLTPVWNGANWYEREAYDLYGIRFNGHEDLRRILTDYGFSGHPFRKDFPVSGHVEMRYDEVEKRVVYQPVSIDPREITPRIVREAGFGELGGMDRLGVKSRG